MHHDLKLIADFTNDSWLREQIQEAIAYDLNALSKITDDRGDMIYVLRIMDCVDGTELGHYRNLAYVLKVAREYRFNYETEKFQIRHDGGYVMKARKNCGSAVKLEPRKLVQEFDFPGSHVAHVDFAANGSDKTYYSFELPIEEDIRVNEHYAFKNAYILIPNPYEKGGRVRLIETDLIGKVRVSHEDLNKHLEKSLLQDAKEDWLDASITVRYTDDGDENDNMNPIYLGKFVEE